MESHQTHHDLMRQDTVSDFTIHRKMSKLMRAETSMDFQSTSDSCSHNSSLFRAQTQADLSSSTPQSAKSSNIFQQETLMDTQMCSKAVARRPADVVGYFISLNPRVEDFVVTAEETIELGRHQNCTIRIASDELISKKHCTIMAKKMRKRSSFLTVPSASESQYILIPSTNGTYINGVRIGQNSHQMSEGDVISLVHPSVSDAIAYRFTTLLQRATNRSPSSPISPFYPSDDWECCTSPLQMKKRRQEIEMDSELIKRSMSLFDEPE